MLTDPPYFVDYVKSKEGLTKISQQKDILNDEFKSENEYVTFCNCWLSAIVPKLSAKNSIYIFNSDRMIFALKKALDQNQIKLSQLLIWVKQQPVLNRMDYLGMHELIFYAWHGSHQFHKSKDKSVIFYPKPNKSPLHPTMKPVGILRRLILNSSKVGDIIFDGFLGSGSTLIAAEQTKRICYGVELDPDYCQTIIDRWEKLTNQKAVKL